MSIIFVSTVLAQACLGNRSTRNRGYLTFELPETRSVKYILHGFGLLFQVLCDFHELSIWSDHNSSHSVICLVACPITSSRARAPWSPYTGFVPCTTVWTVAVLPSKASESSVSCYLCTNMKWIKFNLIIYMTAEITFSCDNHRWQNASSFSTKVHTISRVHLLRHKTIHRSYFLYLTQLLHQSVATSFTVNSKAVLIETMLCGCQQ